MRDTTWKKEGTLKLEGGSFLVARGDGSDDWELIIEYDGKYMVLPLSHNDTLELQCFLGEMFLKQCGG